MENVFTIKIDRTSLVRKLKDGVILNILIRLKGVIYVPILVNILNKDEVGNVSLIISLSGLFIGFSLFNLPDSANRYLLNQDRAENTKTISFIINTCFLLFVFSSILLFLGNRLLNYKNLLFISILILFLLSRVINKLSVFVFEVYQQTKVIARNIIVIEYLSLAVIAGCYFLHLNLNYAVVILLQAGINIIFSCFLFKKLFAIYPFSLTLNYSQKKNLFKTSAYLLPVVYGTWIIQSSDYIFVEHYFGSSVLATYSFSYSLASIVTGLSFAITFFWYSSVVKLIEDKERLTKLLKKILGGACILILFVLAFYYCFIKGIIRLINSTYLSSFKNINILISGLFVNLIIQIYSGILYAFKKESYLMWAWVIGASLNIFLNLYFLKFKSTEFASLSTSIAYILILFLLSLAVVSSYKKLFTPIMIIMNFFILVVSLGYTIYSYKFL